jgi:hypothetical protein
MAYSYRDDVTRPRVRDIAGVGAAVIFLALLSGVYLSAWLSLPFALTMAASLAILGSCVVRRHRNALRRLRELQVEIDSSQLRLGVRGSWRAIVCREDVRAITHDEDDVIAVYDRDRVPVLRVGLRALENGGDLWAQLRQWGPVIEVPRGQFSAPESLGALLGIGLFAGLSMFTREPTPVVALGTVSIASYCHTCGYPGVIGMSPQWPNASCGPGCVSGRWSPFVSRSLCSAANRRLQPTAAGAIHEPPRLETQHISRTKANCEDLFAGGHGAFAD